MYLPDLLDLITSSPLQKKGLATVLQQRKECPYCHSISGVHKPVLKLIHPEYLDPSKSSEYEDFIVWINRNIVHVEGGIGKTKTHINFCPICGRNLKAESLKRKD